MKNPKKIAKGAAPQVSAEEKIQAIYRQYSQKFSVYMEAATFNMLGNSAYGDKPFKDIIADAAVVAEQLIDAIPDAVNAAFDRRMEKAAQKAEAEAKEEK